MTPSPPLPYLVPLRLCAGGPAALGAPRGPHRGGEGEPSQRGRRQAAGHFEGDPLAEAGGAAAASQQLMGFQETTEYGASL